MNAIILGVNGSEESVRAAAAGARIAQRAGAACVPVYAAPDYAEQLTGFGLAAPSWLVEETREKDRQAILASLHGRLPAPALYDVVVRTGRPSLVLRKVARERQAGLITLGSRPRRGLDRLGHDCARHLLRTCETPLLIANGGGGPVIRRVLAAIDLSHAARPTIEAALRWREMLDAELRVIHAIEPLPAWADAPAQAAAQVFDCDACLMELGVRPLLSQAGVECVVRHGSPANVIRREVSRWKADLLIVGSHGRGFVDRLLIGSTTERLIRRVPTLTVVVPVARPSDQRPLEIESLPWEERRRRSEAPASIAHRRLPPGVPRSRHRPTPAACPALVPNRRCHPSARVSSAGYSPA